MMKKLIGPVFVFLVLVLAVSTVRSEEKKYTLKSGYPAGKYLMKIIMKSDILVDGGGQAMPMQQEQTYVYAVTAEEKGADGSQKVDMDLTRITMKMQAMGTEINFDSDEKEDKNAMPNPAFAMLRQLVGIKLSMYFDAEGNMTKIEGFDAFWEKMIEDAGPMAQEMITQMKEQFKPESLLGLGQLNNLIPKNPVAIGDSWKNEFNTAIPMLGELKGEMNNTLQKVENREGVEVAVIEGTSKVGTESVQEMSMGPIKLQFKELSMEQTGVTHLEVVTGLTISNSSQTKMNAVMKMDIPEIAGMEAGEIEVPEFKMDIKMDMAVTVERAK